MGQMGSLLWALVRRTGAFLCRRKACNQDPKDFAGNRLVFCGLDTPSVNGFSEVEAAREREIVSVIGSPNGSESVSGTMSQLLHGAGRSRAIDWFSVGTWTGVSESVGLKKC